jgi:hypothetical protein
MYWDHVDVIGLIDLQVVPGQKEPAFGFFHAGWFMGKGAAATAFK